MDLSCDNSKAPLVPKDSWATDRFCFAKRQEWQRAACTQTCIGVGSGHRALCQVNKPALEGALITALSLNASDCCGKELVHLLKLDSETSLEETRLTALQRQDVVYHTHQKCLSVPFCCPSWLASISYLLPYILTICSHSREGLL